MICSSSSRDHQITAQRTRSICRLHALLCLLIEVRVLDAARQEVRQRHVAAIEASKTTVTDVYGIRPLMAAIIVGRVGDIRRFPTSGHFVRHNGRGCGHGACSRSGPLCWEVLRSGSASLLRREAPAAEVLPMASIADQHGPFLRVEEAARLLCISRTSAYVLARQWLDSGGACGLPAVRIGRSIRIPAVALDRLADPDNDTTTVVSTFALRDAG